MYLYFLFGLIGAFIYNGIIKNEPIMIRITLAFLVTLCGYFGFMIAFGFYILIYLKKRK